MFFPYWALTFATFLVGLNTGALGAPTNPDGSGQDQGGRGNSLPPGVIYARVIFKHPDLDHPAHMARMRVELAQLTDAYIFDMFGVEPNTYHIDVVLFQEYTGTIPLIRGKLAERVPGAVFQDISSEYIHIYMIRRRLDDVDASAVASMRSESAATVGRAHAPHVTGEPSPNTAALLSQLPGTSQAPLGLPPTGGEMSAPR